MELSISLLYTFSFSVFFFLPGEPHIALFDFQPQDYRELKLSRGELVRVISVDSGGWAKAVNQHKKYGWIPQNFVIPIDPKKYQEIQIRAEVIIMRHVLNIFKILCHIGNDGAQKNGKCCSFRSENISNGKIRISTR